MGTNRDGGVISHHRHINSNCGSLTSLGENQVLHSLIPIITKLETRETEYVDSRAGAELEEK